MSVQLEEARTESTLRSGSDISLKTSAQNGKSSQRLNFSISAPEGQPKGLCNIPRNDSNNSLQTHKTSRPPLMKNGSVSMEDLSDEKLKAVLKISENNDSDSNSSREPSIASRQNSEMAEITSTDELLGSTCVVLSVKQVVEALSSTEISDPQFTQAELLEVTMTIKLTTGRKWSPCSLLAKIKPVRLIFYIWKISLKYKLEGFFTYSLSAFHIFNIIEIKTR